MNDDWWHDNMTADDINDAILLRQQEWEIAEERRENRAWGWMFAFVAVVWGAVAAVFVLNDQIVLGLYSFFLAAIAAHFMRSAFNEVRR